MIALLKGADTDNSGQIDYTEFLAATIDAQIYMRDDYIRTAFDMFDSDGNGAIDKNELKQILQGEDMENLVSQEQVQIYL